MHFQDTRKLARSTHIAIALFQFFYIYTPLHSWHYGLAVVQWITFPLLLLSGVWMAGGRKIWYFTRPEITR